MAETTQPDKRCMLLELPPQLRNRIYEAVFPKEELLTSSHTLPAILKTCKTTHNEGKLLYYSTTIFNFGWAIVRPFGLASNRPDLDILALPCIRHISTIRYTSWLSQQTLLSYGFYSDPKEIQLMLERDISENKVEFEEAGIELAKVQVPWPGNKRWEFKALSEIDF